MKKKKIIANLHQTLKTIREFNSQTPTKAELNYKVVGQVIEEFAEALLFLFDEEVEDKTINIFKTLAENNEKGS